MTDKDYANIFQCVLSNQAATMGALAQVCEVLSGRMTPAATILRTTGESAMKLARSLEQFKIEAKSD